MRRDPLFRLGWHIIRSLVTPLRITRHTQRCLLVVNMRYRLQMAIILDTIRLREDQVKPSLTPLTLRHLATLPVQCTTVAALHILLILRSNTHLRRQAPLVVSLSQATICPHGNEKESRR